MKLIRTEQMAALGRPARESFASLLAERLAGPRGPGSNVQAACLAAAERAERFGLTQRRDVAAWVLVELTEPEESPLRRAAAAILSGDAPVAVKGARLRWLLDHPEGLPPEAADDDADARQPADGSPGDERT